MWFVDRQSVMSEVLDGEAVIVDFTTGRYHAAAGVAATVWEGVVGGRSLDEIMDDVRTSYTNVPDDAEVAVTAFIDTVVEAALATPTDGAPTTPVDHPSPMAPVAPVPWSVPVLESHDDLADLMLIDPVHDVTARGWPDVPSAGS